MIERIKAFEILHPGLGAEEAASDARWFPDRWGRFRLDRQIHQVEADCS